MSCLWQMVKLNMRVRVKLKVRYRNACDVDISTRTIVYHMLVGVTLIFLSSFGPWQEIFEHC
jgi:hypothetical protein